MTLNLPSVPLPPAAAFFLLVWILYFISISTKENSHRTMHKLVSRENQVRWLLSCMWICLLLSHHSKALDSHLKFACILHFIENKTPWHFLLCLCAANVTCTHIHLNLTSVMNFSFKMHHLYFLPLWCSKPLSLKEIKHRNTSISNQLKHINHKQKTFHALVLWCCDTATV